MIAAVLMALLGVARGGGGVLLLLQAGATMPEIVAGDGTVRVLGALLVAIGLLEVVSAIGVWRLDRRFWLLGIAVTVAFVVDGAVNGWLLFGRPGEAGTLVNVVVASVIIGCLWATRRSFVPRAASRARAA
jgi:hypothetical protein